MGDIELQTSNPSAMGSDTVVKEEFYKKLQDYFNAQSDKTKKPEWTSAKINQVINIVEDYKLRKIQHQKITSQQYYHAHKYDVMEVNNEKILIMKPKTESSPLIQIIPSENYYDIILETHLLTGHGGRDKVLHNLRGKCMVPIFAIKIFLTLCPICVSKRSITKSGTDANVFNRKGHVNLIDFQFISADDYKWLMNYQDQQTKFCYLRPLKSNKSSEMATELLKIFLEVGCPDILQSGHGRDFTASVIKELGHLWPICKIVNGGPYQPDNQDIQDMLEAWMKENNSTNWPMGCYFVQFQANTCWDSIIEKTPYEALFGHNPMSLSFANLPDDIMDELENEEDLEKIEPDIITTVQKRWKNVKDTYTKSLRLQKDSNCKKRPYIHTDALKFLDTIKREDNKHFLEDLLDDNSENESSHKIKIEETDLYENSNIDYSDDTSGTDTQDGTSKKIKTEEIELYENPIADAGHSPEFVQDAMSNDHSFENVKKSLIKDYIVRKEKRAKPKPPPPVVKPKPKIVIEKIEKNDENDPDMLFLLSMLPLFKKLDEEKKMTARIELTQVLQKLLYANK